MKKLSTLLLIFLGMSQPCAPFELDANSLFIAASIAGGALGVWFTQKNINGLEIQKQRLAKLLETGDLPISRDLIEKRVTQAEQEKLKQQILQGAVLAASIGSVYGATKQRRSNKRKLKTTRLVFAHRGEFEKSRELLRTYNIMLGRYILDENNNVATVSEDNDERCNLINCYLTDEIRHYLNQEELDEDLTPAILTAWQQLDDAFNAYLKAVILYGNEANKNPCKAHLESLKCHKTSVCTYLRIFERHEKAFKDMLAQFVISMNLIKESRARYIEALVQKGVGANAQKSTETMNQENEKTKNLLEQHIGNDPARERIRKNLETQARYELYLHFMQQKEKPCRREENEMELINNKIEFLLDNSILEGGKLVLLRTQAFNNMCEELEKELLKINLHSCQADEEMRGRLLTKKVEKVGMYSQEVQEAVRRDQPTLFSDTISLS